MPSMDRHERPAAGSASASAPRKRSAAGGQAKGAGDGSFGAASASGDPVPRPRDAAASGGDAEAEGADMRDISKAEMAEGWSRVLERSRRELGQGPHDSWVSQLSPIGIEGGIARLAAPTVFIADWIDRHYAGALLRLLREEFEDVSRVEFRAVPRGLF